MLYSCYIARCGNLRTKLRPQYISATSDAQSVTLVQILPSAMPTPTHICNLGCSEHCSLAYSAVGNADLNTYLPPRMPRALLSYRFCRPQCRPQHRSATSDARNVTLVQILPSAMLTPTQICHLGCPERYSLADSAVGDADLNPDLSPRMPRPRCPRLLCTLQHRLPKTRFKNTHTSEAWTPGTSTQIPSCLLRCLGNLSRLVHILTGMVTTTRARLHQGTRVYCDPMCLHDMTRQDNGQAFPQFSPRA